jgi:EmrB/QacA subfamily drug resistance transporter
MSAMAARNGTRKWWALGALALATLAVGLDGTVLSVALPTLAGALHATETDLQWFSSGYLLVLAAAMLPVGLFGDRIGRKKVLLLSLLLFGAGSAACAFAPNPSAFIAARFALGFAGAGIVVMNLSALTVLFAEEERPRAVGVWAAANFLSLPVGPVFGGWLLTNYWWGWVFLMNVPVALIGLLAAIVLIPESRARQRPGLDLVGIVTSTAGLVGVTYGLIEAGRYGWTDNSALIPIGAGLALLVVFFLWEAWLTHRPNGQPLIDLALFRARSFTWGVLLAATAGLAMIGALFTLPQYFQGVLGTDAMGSGLRLLPLIGGLVVGAVPADRLVRRIGAKLVVALGFLLLALGLLVGAFTSVGSGTNPIVQFVQSSAGIDVSGATSVATGDGFVAAWLAVVGLGLGFAFATSASAALSELSEERSGVGAAVMQALQKTGGPLGVAIMGSVLSTAYVAQLDLTALPPSAAQVVQGSLFGGIAVAGRLGSVQLLAEVRAAFVYGMDVSLVVGAGIAAAGILLTLAFLPARTGRKAQESAAAAVSSVSKEGELVIGR